GPVVDGCKQYGQRNDSGNVHPFRWVAGDVQDDANCHDQRNGKGIANVHGALVETRLRLEHNVAVGTTRVHYVELRQFGNGVCEDVTLAATRAFTLQNRAEPTCGRHAYSICTKNIR